MAFVLASMTYSGDRSFEFAKKRESGSMLKVIKPLLVSVVALSLGMDASSTAAFGAGFRGGGQGRVVAAHGFGGPAASAEWGGIGARIRL